MREKTIEEHLTHTVRLMGGLAPKFVSPGLDGVPDRLLLLPNGRMAFAELKAPANSCARSRKDESASWRRWASGSTSSTTSIRSEVYWMNYQPHEYQQYATDFILTHPIAAVLLEMGLGKSVITLTAIQDLCLDSFLVHRVLVIAPLRVARDTWPTEIQKWDHLQELSYSVAVGTAQERRQRFRSPPSSTSSTGRMCNGSLKKVASDGITTWS